MAMQTATQPNAASLEQELQRRGLGAYNGQYRSAPLDFGRWDQASSNASGSSVNSASASTAATTGDHDALDPQQAAAFDQLVQENGEQGADYIMEALAGVLGAGALYGAYRLWRSRRGGTNSVHSRAATGGGASGELPVDVTYEDPTRPALPSDVTPIDGEFSEQRLLTDRRALPGPNTTSAIADNTSTGTQSTPTTIREQLEASAGARRRMSREQAQGVADRAARGQPSDVGTIAGTEDLGTYSEEDIRRANAIADELIAQRTGRGRGSTSAPVYAPRANEPVANQRPALVNEILRVMREAITNPAVARQLPRVIR